MAGKRKTKFEFKLKMCLIFVRKAEALRKVFVNVF